MSYPPPHNGGHMNTKIRFPSPKSGVRNEVPLSLSAPKTSSTKLRRLAPPTRAVRALCAAFLLAPIILGVLLSFKIPNPYTLCTHWYTLVHTKKISPQPQPSNPASETITTTLYTH